MLKIRNEDRRQETEIEGAKFFYKVLNGEDEAKLHNSLMEVSPKGKISWKAGELILRTIEFGLLGWENVTGEDGNPLEFKKEFIKFLPRAVREKLYELITETKLTTEESKNL